MSLRKITEHISSIDVTDALRIMTLLLFAFVFEFNLASSSIFYPDLPRFSLFDFKLAENLLTFQIVEILFIGLLIGACWKTWQIPCSFLAASVGILAINLDLGRRAQFSYLSVFACLAFVVSELLSRSERWKNRRDLPILFLLGTIYGFAAFHKLINFEAMQVSLPRSILGYGAEILKPLCEEGWHCTFLQACTWLVIPIEAAMAITCFSKGLLKPRLILVAFFHWTVAALSIVTPVSLGMMGLHLYLACLQRPERAQALFHHRRWLLFASFEIFLVGGFFSGFWWSASLGSYAALAGNICRASAALWPLFFLGLPFLYGDATSLELSPYQWQKQKGSLPKGVAEICGGLFVTSLFLFGFSPLLLNEAYSITSIGWVMFSGGYTRSYRYVLNVPANECFFLPEMVGVFHKKKMGDQYSYLTTREVFQKELLSVFLNQRHCMTEAQILTEKQEINVSLEHFSWQRGEPRF